MKRDEMKQKSTGGYRCEGGRGRIEEKKRRIDKIASFQSRKEEEETLKEGKQNCTGGIINRPKEELETGEGEDRKRQKKKKRREKRRRREGEGKIKSWPQQPGACRSPRTTVSCIRPHSRQSWPRSRGRDI